MRSNPSLNRAKHRIVVIFIGIPVIVTLILLDAICAAWDEMTGDWRGFKGWLAWEWHSDGDS